MNTRTSLNTAHVVARLGSLAAALLCAAALLLALAPSALAKGATTYILDDYGLYDSSTAQELEQQASGLAASYGVAPYLVVVDDIIGCTRLTVP